MPLHILYCDQCHHNYVQLYGDHLRTKCHTCEETVFDGELDGYCSECYKNLPTLTVEESKHGKGLFYHNRGFTDMMLPKGYILHVEKDFIRGKDIPFQVHGSISFAWSLVQSVLEEDSIPPWIWDLHVNKVLLRAVLQDSTDRTVFKKYALAYPQYNILKLFGIMVTNYFHHSESTLGRYISRMNSSESPNCGVCITQPTRLLIVTVDDIHIPQFSKVELRVNYGTTYVYD